MINIAPIAYILVAAFAILLIDLFSERLKKIYVLISILAAIVAFITLWDTFEPHAKPFHLFSQALVIDNIYRFTSLLILFALFLVILFSHQYVEKIKVKAGEYYSLLLVSAAGMMLLVASNDFITLFLSLEILSICLYVLTGITRYSIRSNEASLKYFIIGAFATGFILYGMTLLYGASGTIYLNKVGSNIKSDFLALIGMLMLIIGICFKIGAVPFHMWVPDVYEGAPTAITSFMSVTVKAAGFALLIRVIMGITGLPAIGESLWIIAVATMLIGNIFAIAQSSVKRMLAYSSIAHTGYALIGVVMACSTKSAEAISATFYYLLIYTFMTLGAFAFIIYASRNGKEAENYDDYAGLSKVNPWSAFAMTIFMLSLSGIPPTAGFFAKFYLFKVAIENHFYALAIIGILATIISLYYYLKVIVMMYMKEPMESTTSAISSDAYEGIDLTLALAVSFTILFGLTPSLYLAIVSRII